MSGTSSDAQWAVETRGLVKRFGSNVAVNGVDLRIPRGCAFGYLGPNGSGKSTTVKMMTGLLHPTAGEVLFLGRNIRNDSTAFKQRLGYVPEEPNLYGYLTGLEYLQLAGGLRGLPGAAQTHRLCSHPPPPPPSVRPLIPGPPQPTPPRSRLQ